jgi:hypothetical protein
MATRLQFRKFSTTSIATLVGANGELYVDTTKKTIVVQDGATTGGSTLATESWVSSALGTVSFNTSVLNGYALSSTLTSYTTNANLTSTLALFTVSKLQYSSLTVQLDSAGSVTFSTDSKIRNGYPGNAGSSNDGSSWFVTPPSQPGGVASANGEQYIQINNGVHVEIGTNYTSSSGYAWIFDQSGNTIFPTGVTHSSSGSGVKFTSGYDKSFQIETTTTSTSKLWNFTAQGNLTLPQGGDIRNSSGNSVLGGSTFDSSSLTSYTTNANLTSTLTSYTTNANLTSTLAGYTTNANLTSTLTGYATNANLTSTVTTAVDNLVNGAPGVLDTIGEIATALNNNSSILNTLVSNANLTSTLASYTTNANLTSTLASYVPTTSLLTVTTLTANTVTITNTSNATTTATGALIVSGGIGVAKDIFLAQAASISIGNSLNLTQNTITTNSASLRIIGGGGQTTRTNIFMTNNAGMALWGGSSTFSPPSAPYGVKIYGGDGPVSIGSGSSESLRLATSGVMVNYVHIQGSNTGTAVNIASSGTNTNIDISFTPKGSSGVVQFGTYTASSTLTIVGYVEIKDSSGTIRRLAVVG